MSIKRMDLSWITISDLKKAEQFFVQTLGLKVAKREDSNNWLELVGEDGGSLLGIGQHSEEYSCADLKPGQNAVVTMTVDNIEQSKAELEQKGIAFYGDIMEVPRHVKMALFADPDGNKFQLVEVLSQK